MKLAALLVSLGLAVACSGQAASNGGTQETQKPSASASSVANDFASRSSGVNVPGGSSSIIRAIDFDADTFKRSGSPTLGLAPFFFPINGTTDYSRISIDTATKAEGAGALKFTVTSPSSHGSDAGAFVMSFNDKDFSNQVGPGQEMCYQFRYRMDTEAFKTTYLQADGSVGLGNKIAFLTEGDNAPPGHVAISCEPIEVILQDTNQKRAPQGYHSCGQKDGSYEPFQSGPNSSGAFLRQPALPCVYSQNVPPSVPQSGCYEFKPNQWHTLEVCVKVGTWYTNDRNYHKDSTVTGYAADENGDPVTLWSYTDYDLVNGGGDKKFGKIWLAPGVYGTSRTQNWGTTHYWYDSLIVAKRFIPFPGSRVPNPPDSLKMTIVSSSSLKADWRDQSSDETGFKVYRCKGKSWDCYYNGKWNLAGNVDANTTTFTDKGLSSNTVYTYYVVAYNDRGNSARAGGSCWWNNDNPCHGTAKTK
ncbi:MAG TPA: fibronectin type III domain-containing protein [Terriglobales bacterium]|nr:fibronectin type III domain-containing protein [Terriglobales bacterium]